MIARSCQAIDDHKSKVRNQFGRSAGDYATSDVHARGESLDVLLERVQVHPDWHALDVATGAGHTAILFAPLVASMIAADITDSMLQQTATLAEANGILNLQTANADAESLPFPDDSFDLVCCRLAFHHFQNPALALQEMVRVLKPGGTFAFTDNITVEDEEAGRVYNEFETIRDPSHHWVAPLQERIEQFQAAGLEVSSTERLSKEFEFHKWADRQRVSDQDKQKLISIMKSIPEALRPLFQPRFADDTMYFSLWEVVIIARKQD